MRIVVGLIAFTSLGLTLAASQGAPGSAVHPVAASAPAAETVFRDDKLRGDLADIVGDALADELIPITIVMRDQAPQEELDQAAGIADKSDRRAAVVALLKDVAAGSQGRILRVLEDGQREGDVSDRVRALWLRNVIATDATPGMIRRIARRNDVAYLNYDRPMGEELFPVLPEPGLDIDGGSALAGNIECGVALMRAPEVWNDFGNTGEGSVIGIIDTGACITHPDLVNQIWDNPGEIPNNNIDDDNNGYIDDIHGWNFWQNNDNIADSGSHGTHTGGTVVGDGTNGTVTGMAPDAELMILKFWNSFSGESVVWESMQYATEMNADIITASIGWPHGVGPDRVTWRTVCENSMSAGVVVIYASGNEGGCCPPDNVRTPGDVPDVITAGATDCNDAIAGFSSRGPITWQSIPPWNDWPYPPGKIKPTVSAPGVNTVSTSSNCSGYTTMSGTSMATPHIAGAAALILAANPSLDHFGVKQILMDTAVDLGENGMDNNFGAGRVDVYEAVVVAMDSSGKPADLTSVSVTFGTHLSGGLAEINSSDDTYVQTRSAFNFVAFEPTLMDLSVTAVNDAIANAASIDIRIESRINQAAGTAKVRARNWNTNNFDEVSQYAIGTSEETVTTSGLDGSLYVRDGNAIEIDLSVKHVVAATFSASGFDSFFDLVEIIVH